MRRDSVWETLGDSLVRNKIEPSSRLGINSEPRKGKIEKPAQRTAKGNYTSHSASLTMIERLRAGSTRPLAHSMKGLCRSFMLPRKNQKQSTGMTVSETIKAPVKGVNIVEGQRGKHAPLNPFEGEQGQVNGNNNDDGEEYRVAHFFGGVVDNLSVDSFLSLLL
jgi:hypothetical protein